MIFNFQIVLKIIISFALIGIKTEVLDLTDDNFDQYISTYELVFITFHAEWCRYSNQMIPILRVVDEVLLKEYNERNRVLIARVNCDENSQLSTRHKISKYPTLKFFINGVVMKKEYRGQRNEESLISYIKDLLTDPVVRIHYESHTDLSAIMYNKSAVIGYFTEGPERHHKYDIFRRVASNMRGYCEFYWVTNSPFIPQGKTELLAFKSYKSTTQSEYDLIYETYEEFSTWSTQLCIPLVRVITFENAEEIIEEDLPLVILFHNSDDERSVEIFKDIIHRELIVETSSVNFVTADAKDFNHPLVHLGKTVKDLPLIAIDSFKHMYLFPNFEDLNKTHILENFIEDLKSGKLHREYHFGPEDGDHEEHHEVEEEQHVQEGQHEGVVEHEEVHHDESGQEDHAEHHESDQDHSDEEEEEDDEDELTPVANSVFKNLAPSEHRYSLLRDEL